MKPNLYVYKMTADNGGAPCVWEGLLSLAICKGEIRRMAEKGSIIFGFGSKKEPYNEHLLYIAVVTQKLPPGEYYRNPCYEERPDCIYELGEDGMTAKRKKDAKYHTNSDERKRDVGIKFEKANVLVSDDFRYFGKKGTNDYKKEYPSIGTLIEDLKRGHRVNHEPKLRNDLQRLRRICGRIQNRTKGSQLLQTKAKDAISDRVIGGP